ncbi:MAG: STAS domain-containing protein, partial [Planctomycetaceae bacterium]|nr:STAS domain-containing protein [Planctomycetaceae bacterium]
MEKSGQIYEFEQFPEHGVLVLKPPMNDAQWSEIEKAGDEVLHELETITTPNLIVDLSELDFIGSAMVALVVRIWKIVKTKKAQMVVVNRNPLVLEVLSIAKLNDVWTIVEFREDAMFELGISEEVKTKTRESKLLTVVGVVAAIGGAAALGVHKASPGLLDKLMVQILAFGLSGLGILLGMWLLFMSVGGRRAVGALAMIVSLAVLVGAVTWVPIKTEAAPNPPLEAEDSKDTPVPDQKTDESSPQEVPKEVKQS